MITRTYGKEETNMNNRIILLTLLAGSMLLISGCSEDNSSFETPNSSITTNAGIVSQKNLSILAEDVNPPIFDPATGGATDTSLTITVKIGDLNNVLLTDEHTIYFATEWGLIQPSCVTSDGACTVTWQTSFGPGGTSSAPADRLNTITAWTLGEESFIDSNSNGVFDDEDTTFTDRDEPFIDSVNDGVFDASNGDRIIDVINGNDLTGINGVHDIGDTFLNSPHCTHSSLCSTVLPISYIWTDIQINMLAPVTAR